MPFQIPRLGLPRYSLRTLLVVVTVLAVGLYWPVRSHQATVAAIEYQFAAASFDTDTVTAADVCEASLKMYRAQCAVPFADREKAAVLHFAHVEHVWQRESGPASEWFMGVNDEKSFAEAQARMAKIKANRDEAARMAGIDLTD